MRGTKFAFRRVSCLVGDGIRGTMGPRLSVRCRMAKFVPVGTTLAKLLAWYRGEAVGSRTGGRTVGLVATVFGRRSPSREGVEALPLDRERVLLVVAWVLSSERGAVAAARTVAAALLDGVSRVGAGPEMPARRVALREGQSVRIGPAAPAALLPVLVLSVLPTDLLATPAAAGTALAC